MKSVLLPGGAGFIGINVAADLIDRGYPVVIIDNLRRRGTEDNLIWLKRRGKFNFIKGDIRNYQFILRILREYYDTSMIIHLAAQTAVTFSLINPREDFEINALGTLNLLEAIREVHINPLLIYSSTNKVYGSLDSVKLIEKKTRFEFEKNEFKKYGLSETILQDFHSPYGCSKGCADQYVRDYARIYGLDTVVFRQSCIYGPHQYGVEDQGWVAWFMISSILGNEMTIYGNGKQVRDILFIDDLVDSYLLAWKYKEKTRGKIYNIGGGPNNTLSLLELIALIEKKVGLKAAYHFSDWRRGDQKIFVSDIRKAEKDFLWKPRFSVEKGVKKLISWVSLHKEKISKILDWRV